MQQHRLAAIMFTDIVGYTALMGSDEERAFEVLQNNRDIHFQFLKKYAGTLIKEMGDGMLVSFDLASDAVRCAIEIQIACRKKNISLRIGIHEAEVVFEGSDVFGDGVNIASRLQASTNEGCIAISESVYRDVKNKADIRTQFIEEKSLKNVDEPIRMYNVSCEEPPVRECLVENSVHDQRKPIIARLLRTVTPVLITVVVAIIIFILYGSTSIPFTERDWIVISDFENLTDETIFDHSLNTAFTLSINQSRYLNVLTRQRMIETLKRMEKENITNIDEETGKEIAIREGVEIIIVPTISKVGTQYILTAKILDTKTANILKSEVLYAKSEDEIIEKLDLLSKKIRRSLGETRNKISDQSKPLKKVTTSSLQALKQYSLGIESHLRLDFEKARIHYENAIRIDSDFTAAKASLGNLLFEKFDRNEGRKWLEEAIISIDNLTDREKYGILAFYAVNVENNLDKGIVYTKRRIGLYPDDPAAHNNLGWYFQKQGHYNMALDEYKKTLQISPNMMLTNSGIIWVYLEYFGQMDSALFWSNRMIKYAPDNPWGYFYLGTSYVGLNDFEKAEAAFLKAGDLNPNFLMNQYRLAHDYRLQGMYDKAIEVLEAILQKNPQESSAHYDLGINYNLMGKKETARSHFLEYKKIAAKWLEENPNDPKLYVYNGIVLTRLGEKDAGWEIGKRAFELDSTINFEFTQLLAVQDRKSEALDYLEKALANGYRDLAWIKLHPDLELLFREVRYKDLMNRYFKSQ
ncbi:MAG: tetratricopeptide repeat protein [Maribacter sp.]|nr:tetratricopeptide repeat protein [Maribacter sp.]